MQSSVKNIQTNPKKMRLALLMEIERRKQAKETLEQIQLSWWKLREQLAHVGLFLPLDPTTTPYIINIADDEIRRGDQVCLLLGSDMTKSEVEMEMRPFLEAKNFEIALLSDRLSYYETANEEMFQHNQETIEVVRRKGQKRKRRRRWIWGSIVVTIMLGSGVLASSYLPFPQCYHQMKLNLSCWTKFDTT